MSNHRAECETIRGVLVDRAMGELDAPAEAALERHLADCAACRHHADEVEAAVKLLKAAPSVAPSKGFDAALNGRLDAERGREPARWIAVFAAMAAGLRRLRQFELGVAVYPLVLLSLGYVIWALVTREPGIRDRVASHEITRGRLMISPYSRAEEKREAVAVIEEVVAKAVPDVSDDLYEPGEAEVDLASFDPGPLRFEPLPAVEAAPEPPPTKEALVRWPDPAERVRLVLPVGRPGGSALARARFTTIKNSKPHIRRAISRGLVWLCKDQKRPGLWTGGAGGYADEEITAAAALAFMESGFTAYGKSKPSKHLRAALTWLVRRRRADGMFAAPGPRQWHAQAMACIALSEALRLSDRESARKRFRPLVQEAVAKLVEGQSASGAWGSEDAELTALVVFSSGSARAAGLAVDAASHETALAWLDSYEKKFSSLTYAREGLDSKASKSASYAAIGRVMGCPTTSWAGEGAERAAKGLAEAPVIWASGDFFRWYVGTLAAYRLNGRFWQEWRDGLLLQLLPHQHGWLRSTAVIKADLGSWEPHGNARDGGRAYSTAMAVLALTASCGHSPVYGGAK